MYRKSFPSCKVKGNLEPHEFGHMLSEGIIPKKCHECNLMFEGECTRNLEFISEFARLDYRNCNIKGDTNPIVIEMDNNGYGIFVPTKCKHCENLKKDTIRGYICLLNKKVWGDFPCSLDWGDWEPDYPIVGLGDNVKVTEEIIALVQTNKTAKAIQKLRFINGELDFIIAKDSVFKLEEKID